jgi:hypothetical protein
MTDMEETRQEPAPADPPTERKLFPVWSWLLYVLVAIVLIYMVAVVLINGGHFFFTKDSDSAGTESKKDSLQIMASEDFVREQIKLLQERMQDFADSLVTARLAALAATPPPQLPAVQDTTKKSTATDGTKPSVTPQLPTIF